MLADCRYSVLERDNEQREPGKAAKIKIRRGPGAVTQEVQVTVAHYDGGDADRYIDIKHRLPAEVLGENAAEGGADRGADDVAEPPPPNDAASFFFREAFAEDGK